MKLMERLAFCWRILREKPGNLMAHADRELPSVEGDEMQALMNRSVKEMVLVFSTQGHSGFSAPYAIGQLEKLLRFEPLNPLTGADDEWCILDYDDEMKAQNKRCSHVFKRKDGTAYDGQGRVFRRPDGNCYTSAGSRVEITFPYVPKSEYVDVPA